MTNRDTMTSGILGITVMTIASIMLSGCNSEPKRVEADYGNSVHQMVQAATYDPEAAASTESKPVIGMDGKRAIGTLDALRTDTERVDEFAEILNIELGD